MRLRTIGIIACLAFLTACNVQQTPALSLGTTYLSFPGTSTAQVTVTATGNWTASSSQSWLELTPATAAGSAQLTVSVNRTGLQPGAYAGTITVSQGTSTKSISVYMRFPEVSGNVSGPVLSGLLTAAGAGAPGAAALPYAGGRLLVEVDPGYLQLRAAVSGAAGRLAPQAVGPLAVRDALAATVQDHGLALRGLLAPDLPWGVVSTGGLSVAAATRRLVADPRVAAVEPDFIFPLADLHATVGGVVKVQATPNDPYFGDQWDMAMLKMPTAWNATRGSTSVVVAVVDSGVMSGHEDLSGNTSYAGYDFVLDQPGADTPSTDATYHGTHVAGIIGAVGGNNVGIAGTNWTVGILPVRICDKAGCSLSNLVRGIEYAAGLSVYNGEGVLVSPPRQANVINLSLGAARGSPLEEAAVENAASAGTTVVAAAGNDTTFCTAPPQYATTSGSPGPVDYPAAYPAAIAVGSVDYDQGAGSYAVSCFSNTGRELAVAAPGGWLFDNGAPAPLPSGFPDETGYKGFGVLSTYWDATTTTGTYALDEGTSMAAPHVAGIAALMLSVDPNLSPLLVKLILEDTTGAGTFSPALGWGLVDPAQAIAFPGANPAAGTTDFIVRLEQRGTVVQQVHADPGGSYRFSNLAAGTYIVEGGNDPNHNGVLGEAGEFYGTTTVTVSGDGDVTGQGLNARLQ